MSIKNEQIIYSPEHEAPLDRLTEGLTKADRINQLGDSVWIIACHKSGQANEIKWLETFPSANSGMIRWAQSYLRFAIGGYTDNQGNLSSHPSSVEAYVRDLTRLLSYWKLEHPGTFLRDWTIEQQCDWFRFELTNRLDKNDDAEEEAESRVLSLATMRRLFTMQGAIHAKYTSGEILDGFSASVSTLECINLMQPILENIGVDFHEWKEGGSYGAVPIEIAMLLLAEAIQVLRSDKTRYLMGFYRWAREAKYPFAKKGYICFIKYFNTGVKPAHHGGPATRTFSEFDPLINCIIDQYPNCNSKEDLPFQAWPFSYQVKSALKMELSTYLHSCYDAGLIVFLCLTGARKGELASLRSDWIQKASDGSYQFLSEIHKTNHSISTLRDIAGLAAEAVDVMNALGMEDKEKEPGFLFRRCTFTPTNTNRRSKGYDLSEKWAIPSRLDKIYKDFLSRQDSSFRERHPWISPHQFRHTFAEFALRRFDGDVLEAIRVHFRHAYGSYFTAAYTEGKLTETVKAELDRNYLREIILKGAEGKIKLFGPIGQYIKTQLDNVIFGTPDEVQESIEQLTDEFVGTVEPHEWGICVVRKETQTQSKCWDKKSGIPLLDQAAFSKCSGCPHRLTLDNQRENIIRIGMSLQEHVNNYPIPIIADAQREALHRAEMIITEMDKES